MDPIALLTTWYPPDSPARAPLLQHSALVAAKAVAVARRLSGGRAQPSSDSRSMVALPTSGTGGGMRLGHMNQNVAPLPGVD